MASRHRQTGSTLLRNRLVLHRFICHEFGYLEGMAGMLDRLRDLSATNLDPGDESKYATALLLYRNEDHAKVSREQFIAYDANIAALSRPPAHDLANTTAPGSRTSISPYCSPSIT